MCGPIRNAVRKSLQSSSTASKVASPTANASSPSQTRFFYLTPLSTSPSVDESIISSALERCKSNDFTEFFQRHLPQATAIHFSTAEANPILREQFQSQTNEPAAVVDKKYNRYPKSRVKTASFKQQQEQVAVVFHGTSQENVATILQHGLDPGMRLVQSRGRAEYFGANPSVSYPYCHGGDQMLVFLVILSPRCGAGSNIVTVRDTARQLPIGVVHFRVTVSSDSRMLSRTVLVDLRRSKVLATKIDALYVSGGDGVMQAKRLYHQKKSSILNEHHSIVTSHIPKHVLTWFYEAEDATRTVPTNT